MIRHSICYIVGSLANVIRLACSPPWLVVRSPWASDGSSINLNYQQRVQKMMTKEEMHGSWDKIVGTIQEKYSQVTGDELQAVKGNINQLVGLLHRKTGQTREEVEQFLESATGAASGSINRMAETASEFATSAQQSMRQGYDRLVDSSQEGYESARRAVRQSPAESLAVAFGIGIVAGLFVGASLFGRRS